MVDKEELNKEEKKLKNKKKKKNNNVLKENIIENSEPSAALKRGKGSKRKQTDNPKKVKKMAKKQVKDDHATVKNEDVAQLADTEERSNVKKHVVFDDDETFDHLPTVSSLVGNEPPPQEEEDTDSDAPPEEGTISMGKDIFAEEDKKVKNELIKLKNQVREARRQKHEKNREQQMKKKDRLQKLEESRLPLDLLDAVVMEKDEPKEIISTPKKKKKPKLAAANISEDYGIVTLEKGVKVQAIQQEVQKFTSIASIAADFRKQALYNKMVPRMSSRDHRMMDVKQRKAGKNLQ